MDNNEEHLPEKVIQEYRRTSINGLSLKEQLEYWKERAKFFENQTYGLAKQIQETRDDDEADWWKNEE